MQAFWCKRHIFSQSTDPERASTDEEEFMMNKAAGFLRCSLRCNLVRKWGVMLISQCGSFHYCEIIHPHAKIKCRKHFIPVPQSPLLDSHLSEMTLCCCSVIRNVLLFFYFQLQSLLIWTEWNDLHKSRIIWTVKLFVLKESGCPFLFSTKSRRSQVLFERRW